MSRAKRALGPLGLAGLLLFLHACDGSFLDPSLEIPVDGEFSLAPSGISLEVGETVTIVASLVRPNSQPINPRALKWESTSPVAASVDRDGVVRALAPGRTLVIASSGQLADTTDVMVVPAGADKSGITLTPSELALDWLGATTHLTANVYDEDGTLVANPEVRWTTVDPEVVQVDDMGKVTAHAVGAALIVATAVCCDQADTAHAQVRQVVASVAMAPQSVSLAVGETRLLSAEALDEGGSSVEDAPIQWSSSNTSVATVSSGGLVTARGGGSATITAKSGDASGSSSVTVEGGNTSGPPADGGIAELPRVWVNTDWVEPTGQTINVPAGGDLQAAINSARRGDVIVLQAGATFTGDFTLPAKSGSGWITIRSSGALPAPGTRVRPSDAGRMAKLVSTRTDRRVLTAESGASHYRIVGLEITFDNSVTRANAVVDFRNGSSHIILDRSYVHGHSGLDLQRCVILHAEHGAVIDSWLSQCHFKGQDSQAIIAWNTNGPLKIVNNHLEGAGENVMFGGATPSENTLPADIEIRRNHFYKPPSWRLSDGSSLWTVKNLFEIKFASRVLLEGNVFDGNWPDGQDGHAFNIKLSARGSGNRVEDITIRYNILRNSYHGIKYGSAPNRSTIEHNVIYNIERRLFTLLSSQDLHLRYNTARHGHNIITSDGEKHSGFVAVGNIWGSDGGYGVKGGGAEGTSTLNSDFPGWVYEHNGHIGRREDRYPGGNYFVDDEAAARFMDVANGDLRLRSDSPFGAIGADVEGVLELTAGVAIQP
jgi:uncharacterized protein YjdB